MKAGYRSAREVLLHLALRSLNFPGNVNSSYIGHVLFTRGGVGILHCNLRRPQTLGSMVFGVTFSKMLVWITTSHEAI